MISGIIAQEGASVPRGVLIAPECYFDASYDPFSFPTTYAVDSVEGTGQAIATLNVDQIMRPLLVNAADVFQPTNAKRSWVAFPDVVLDVDGVFAPSILLPQRTLQPLLYVAADVFNLPSIAIPGVLQVKLLANDDALFTPLVVAPGALRSALFTDVETIYAPTFTTPLTLRPGRPIDSDSFYAPTARGGMIQPPLFVDADFALPFVTKVSMAVASVVVDADVFPAPSMGVPASLDGRIVGVLNLVMSNGNLTATVGPSGGGAVLGVQSASFKTAGKYYFELTATLFHDIYTAIGIGLTSIDYTGMTGSIRVQVSSGNIADVNNNNVGYSVGIGANGDIYGFAVDLDARLMWIRRNGGLWNGSSTSSPLTGVTGVAIPTGSWAPFVRYANNSVAGDNVTANFGQSPYSTAAPVGFGIWSTVVAKVFSPAVVDNDVFPVTQIGQVVGASVVDSDGFYAPTLTGGLHPATLDGVPSNVTRSNGNLTATHASTATDSGARSTALKSSGKLYFEVIMTTTHGSFDSVGIMTAAATYNDFVSGSINCVEVQKGSGVIYANNVTPGPTLGACTSGDLISVAVDLTARKAWLRKNGGNWNGLALGSENPNTGVGGVTIAPSVAFEPAVGFGGSGTAAGDQMDANFGQSAYAYPAPTGFSNWVA